MRGIEGPDFHEVEDSDYPEMQIAKEEYQEAFLLALGGILPTSFPPSKQFLQEIKDQGRKIGLKVAATYENPIEAPHPIRTLLHEIYGESPTVTEVTVLEEEMILEVEGENDTRVHEVNSSASNFNQGGFIGRTLIFNIPQQMLPLERVAREFILKDDLESTPDIENRRLEAKIIFGLIGIVESVGSHPDTVLMITKQDSFKEEGVSD